MCPDVIKLKACVKHRPLLNANRLAHLQGECGHSALAKRGKDRAWGRTGRTSEGVWGETLAVIEHWRQ